MESDLYRIALLGGLLPGLIVGVGLLLLWGLLRPDRDDQVSIKHRRLLCGAPVLFFLGFLAILGATGPIGPELWSASVADRRLALGALALACALLPSFVPFRALGALVGVGGSAVGGALAAWMVASVYHPHLLGSGDIALWCVAGGLGCAAGAWLQGTTPIGRGWIAPAQAAMVIQGALGLMYWSSQALTAPQLGGLVGMLVAASMASAILGAVSLRGGGWVFIAVVLTGYLTLARVSGDTTPPALSMVLIPAGVVTGALGRWLGRRVRVRLLGAAIALLLTAAPVGGGAVIAWRAYDAAHSADAWEGDDDEDGVYYTDDE